MKERIISRKFLSIIAAVILAAVITLPALASPATATRALPESVASGAEFGVTVTPSSCGAFGQVVETLPDGFAYLNCAPSYIGVEQVDNTVKFTCLDSEGFTYTVRAPIVDTTTTYTFYGVVRDENRNEYPIQDNVITVTVSAPPPETYTLTMAVDGNGSTTPAVGSHSYDAGSVVNISATADSGWRFDHWSGNVADPSSSSTTVTMDSDKTVIAYFVEVSGMRALPTSVVSGTEFDVSIEALGCGIFGQVVESLPEGFTYVGSSLPAEQIEQIGDMLKFTFLADSASFTYRIEAPIVNVTTNYSFHGKVLDEDRNSYPIEDNDIAVFAIYTLTVVCDPPEGGEVSLNPEDQDPTAPGAQYEDGTLVELTATPNDGYAFGSWNSDLTGSNNPNTITMDSDKSVMANFVEFSAPTNVDVIAADPEVESIEVSSKNLSEVDTTNMPQGVEPQQAYIVNSTGDGSFTLKFTNISNARDMKVYKVVDAHWTLLKVTATANTIELTMEVGDPDIVFALLSAPPPTPAIGGEGYFPNMLSLLVPWIALGMVLVGGITWFMLRRRSA